MLAAMAGRTPAPRSTGAARPARWPVAPVLVRQVRGGVVESAHRGDIVEADASGRVLHELGEPERLVNLRSAVKPFGLVALLRAGGQAEFDLTAEELALMASSHSGEDMHVRTLMALHRRTGVPSSALACGADTTPMDALTAARLMRDGERPSQLRHMCSGQHTSFLLLAKLGGWEPETYWQLEHPVHQAYMSAVADAFGVPVAALNVSIDACGVATFAFPLREIARAYAFLANPAAVTAPDPRAAVSRALLEIRDAMLAHPEMVAGSRDRLDTSLMKVASGHLVAKGGAEGLSCIGILAGTRGFGSTASGIAVKIEDGGGFERGSWSATVEALRQVGALEGQAIRVLARYQRPQALDPHGQVVGEAIAEFELAPVGELAG